MRIVIAGYIVGGPLGGLVWHHLQYVIGLHRMGHDIIFIEDSDDYASCYDPSKDEMTMVPDYGIRFIKNIFDKFNLGEKWAYFHAHSNFWYGIPENEVIEFCKSADMFLNLSGVNPVREFILSIPIRVFIDTDPVFTQVRNLTEPSFSKLTAKHNRFFTFGENFGKSNCTTPDDQISWVATRQPVVFNIWPFTPGNPNGNWTTVMQWDSYRTREFEGRFFGMKSTSFDPYLKLPGLINDSIELSIGIDSAPKQRLFNAGWKINNPLQVAKTPESYQEYIAASKGEWSVAKHGYVITNCGWFSERSTSYLASGRPVVVQDTGFSDFLETGSGLFAFSSPEKCIEALSEINRNYKKHCNQARGLAEEYFNSEKVLEKIINKSFSVSN